MNNAEEAVAAWVDAALDGGEAIPPPTSLDAVSQSLDYAGWTFGIVTLAQSVGETHSGAIARLTLEEPRRIA